MLGNANHMIVILVAICKRQWLGFNKICSLFGLSYYAYSWTPHAIPYHELSMAHFGSPGISKLDDGRRLREHTHF